MVWEVVVVHVTGPQPHTHERERGQAIATPVTLSFKGLFMGGGRGREKRLSACVTKM